MSFFLFIGEEKRGGRSREISKREKRTKKSNNQLRGGMGFKKCEDHPES